MDPNAVQGLHALLAMLNQQNVSSEVDRLFSASTPSAASGNTSATTTSSTPSATTTPATLQTPLRVQNIGPLFSARGGVSRGRGRNRSRPYTSVGAQFTRVVILLGDQTENDMACGRARAVICDVQHEARVAFRTGMTSQAVRMTILYAFQAQGYLRTVTYVKSFHIHKHKVCNMDINDAIVQ